MATATRAHMYKGFEDVIEQHQVPTSVEEVQALAVAICSYFKLPQIIQFHTPIDLRTLTLILPNEEVTPVRSHLEGIAESGFLLAVQSSDSHEYIDLTPRLNQVYRARRPDVVRMQAHAVAFHGPLPLFFEYEYTTNPNHPEYFSIHSRNSALFGERFRRLGVFDEDVRRWCFAEFMKIFGKMFDTMAVEMGDRALAQEHLFM